MILFQDFSFIVYSIHLAAAIVLGVLAYWFIRNNSRRMEKGGIYLFFGILCIVAIEILDVFEEVKMLDADIAQSIERIIKVAMFAYFIGAIVLEMKTNEPSPYEIVFEKGGKKQ